MGLLCHWPLIKFQTKESLNCSKFVIDDAGNKLNHTLVAPLRVAGKDLQITSSGVCWRFNIVLNAPMWSRESLVPSSTSNYGRWNLGGRAHFKTLAMNGESILLIMPPRFMAVFPFMAFFISSNFFLILFIIWLLSWVDYSIHSKVSLPLFPGLLALSSLWLWLCCPRDVLLPSGCTCHFKSSFCIISSCTLAVNAWICWAITIESSGAVVVESMGSEELYR